MDPMRRMAVFAMVVEQGSMSAAARLLGMSTSAVSQQVRQLEREGGVTLLHRSTRKLAMTSAGERFYEGCAAMVAAARAAQQQLTRARDAPSGELRVAAPVGVARHVAPALAGLLNEHPALTLRLLVDDRRIDLIEARIDLALRFGPLADSSWAARPIGELAQVLVASPVYLRRHPPLRDANELTGHAWLLFTPDEQARPIELTGPGGAPLVLRVEGRIHSNNQFALQQMCLAGLGISRQVHADVADDLRAGRLVSVLPAWRPNPIAAWAVTPQRDAQPAKVRLSIEALQAHFRGMAAARSEGSHCRAPNMRARSAS